MGNREWGIQLKDAVLNQAIIAAGGKCYVAVAGDPAKVALFDKNGATLANPVTPTRGFINFFAADTVESVDLFIATPGGQFIVRTGVKPSGPNEFLVQTDQVFQEMVIPWAQADFTANTETDTGFDEPTGCVFLADSGCPRVKVTAIDATETIDVGSATAESGDPDGYVSAAAIGVLGLIFDGASGLMTTLVGYTTLGKSIVITTSAGSDTGKGYIYIPYLRFNAA